MFSMKLKRPDIHFINKTPFRIERFSPQLEYNMLYFSKITEIVLKRSNYSEYTDYDYIYSLF